MNAVEWSELRIGVVGVLVLVLQGAPGSRGVPFQVLHQTKGRAGWGGVECSGVEWGGVYDDPFVEALDPRAAGKRLTNRLVSPRCRAGGAWSEYKGKWAKSKSYLGAVQIGRQLNGQIYPSTKRPAQTSLPSSRFEELRTRTPPPREHDHREM